MGSAIEYDFNLGKARQTIVIFTISSFILISLLVFTENTFSSGLAGNRVACLLLGAGYFGCILLLVKRYRASLHYRPKIRVLGSVTVIPTYYLGEKIIRNDEVFSVEKLVANNEIVGLSLGIRNKTAYALDVGRFADPKDFALAFAAFSRMAHANMDAASRQQIGVILAKQQTNTLLATYVICLIAAVVYCIGIVGTASDSEYMRFMYAGANTGATIFGGEIYRFASSVFLHTSVPHLLLNLLMLGIFSQYLEKPLGQTRFANVFLLANVAGVLFSALLRPFEASIGASGGIFGLWGGYTCFKNRYDGILPGSINPVPAGRFYLILCLEVIAEIFIVENADYVNHLGGFVAGFAYIYLITRDADPESVDRPALFEKGLFVTLVSAYALGLSYFLLLYYGVI